VLPAHDAQMPEILMSLSDLWQGLPEELRAFVASDLASWLAVILAVGAVLLAIRRTPTVVVFGPWRAKRDQGRIRIDGNLSLAPVGVSCVVTLFKAFARINGKWLPVGSEPRVVGIYHGAHSVNPVFSLEDVGQKEIQLKGELRTADGAKKKFQGTLPVQEGPL